MIPFNKPYLTGREAPNIAEALAARKLSGDGPFTKRCQTMLEALLGSGRAFLTTSCTDALEAAALLCGIQPGDEVIVPSYTFVSTANAFALRGAVIRFADSYADHPNMDPGSVASLITPRTKAIVPVHYAGVACDMHALAALADQNGLFVVEDAAQGIASSYKGQPLGTLGDFGAFSFHETKNIIAGEGGALHVNRADRVLQAEIVREKGTDRSAFFRGEVDKYGWVSLGSSYLPSEMIAAFLLAQLEDIDAIQARRLAAWHRYAEMLEPLARAGAFELPAIPEYATNNAHMFFLLCPDLETRSALLGHLKADGIYATFHYQALRSSPFFIDNAGPETPHADRFSHTLVRLPLFAELGEDDAERIAASVIQFFKS